MRFLALLLLGAAVAGACPALAEVVILRGSSAPAPIEPPSPPPAPVVVTTYREIVPVPVYYLPIYFVTAPSQVARHRSPARR